MKKILIIASLTLIILSANAQTTEKFEYSSGLRSIIARPKFDQSKAEGKRVEIVFTDNAYVEKLIYKEIREVFSNDDFKKMHRASIALININSSGDVLKCNFIINPEDKNIFSDDKLYNLYLKFKKIKIDMSKTRINGALDTVFDFTELSFRLLPPEFKYSQTIK